MFTGNIHHSGGSHANSLWCEFCFGQELPSSSRTGSNNLRHFSFRRSSDRTGIKQLAKITYETNLDVRAANIYPKDGK
jgi:hypothetical protein